MGKRFRKTSNPWKYIPPKFRGRGLVSLRPPLDSAGEMVAAQRFGFFVKAGSVYSGGRLMLSMYALALERAGAEVWFVTDGPLRWSADFRWGKRLHFAGPTDPLPPDLDCLVTDCRGPVARLAVQYKMAHPSSKLHVVTFETPNWVEQYVPALAALMRKEDFQSIPKVADRLVAISEVGGHYLQELYGTDAPLEVIYPVLNTEAADAATPTLRRRPFAVFAGRPVAHKHLDAAHHAVMETPDILDLVVIGSPGAYRPKGNKAHKVMFHDHIAEVDKFGFLKGARVVLAPSTFEGFGMVPGEALISGTPAVVYDLPVLREAYGDDILYAKHNDPEDFAKVVRGAVAGAKPDMRKAAARTRARFGLDTMPERVQAHPFHAVTRTRLSVSMIAYATPGVESCLAALYPQVDEINIAYGPVPFWRKFPEGGILERIQDFPDPEHKISVDARKVWPDKRVMWESCGSRATGNYMLLTAADMIWVGLDKWLSAGHKFATPRWVNFWHDFKHWVYGPDAATSLITGHALRWGESLPPFGSACHHHLFSWWRPSYTWKTHTQPRDSEGRSLFSSKANLAAATKTPETVCYHFGHALPDDIMRQKHRFYLDRDGGKAAVDVALAARESMWHNWTGKTGPHGDGIIAPVDWELPDEVLAAHRELFGAEAPRSEAAG